ncbi:MAG: hypothetical protein V7K97_28915 [Nostoc sp.]|uniref:hypothetical protein n=1 Tax=Nostoc sp. TaxID=1180 RepID=UPI002FF8142B
MKNNRNIYNQSNSQVDDKSLQASQQLQSDKQTYGSEYIHLYVDDIEGDWLENWDWEDDLIDYIDAFNHHCQNRNYQFAIDTLNACDEQLKHPENYQKSVDLYRQLVELLELKSINLSRMEQEILLKAKERLALANSLIEQVNQQEKDAKEKNIMNIIEPEGNRIGYIKKLLDKIHNGVIRKTWEFEYSVYEDDIDTFSSKVGKANSGEFVVKLGIWDDVFGGGYYLNIENGSEEKEKVDEHTESPTFSVDEYKLIKEYLKKLDAAKWQTKSVDLDALPE